jgi:dynein heavy chain, axonemal
LLDANLLNVREEVEDLASAAVKEKGIERKLDSLRSDWAIQNVSFAEHKNRGPVVIKPSDYAELVERLEESQMSLSSMATNRYSKPFESDVGLYSPECSTLRASGRHPMFGCTSV